ncbi:MAG TPA: hypothetical protein VGO62_01970 [Myxococcota bacterium]
MRYCPYFCEENVWHLCADDAVSAPLGQRHALLISNAARAVKMRHQRAAGGGVVVWDYHVVLAAPGAVHDLDCTLGIPIAAARYVADCFVDDDVQFRMVPAATYRALFASDRSHMDASQHPFPPWPPIGAGMTLPRLLDFTDAFGGDVVDKRELLRRIA